MEAVIAAVYLDGGWSAAEELVLRLLDDRIRASAAGPGGEDFKTRLQELAAERFDQLPRYQVRAEGPDHSKRFFARCASTARCAARERAAPRSRPSRPRPALPGSASTRLREPMPELPEVEVVRRDLEREVVGKRIKGVEVDGMRSVRRHHNRKQFITRLEGKKIIGVERRGKYLLCRLEGGDVLIIHLGMSGQLLRAKTARETCGKHTHVVITFTQGGQLRFVDPRTFGEMFVTEADALNKVSELNHLGLDPLETAMSWEQFGHLISQKHTKLKPLLMDQKFLAGIGNIYSDEILWGAGLKWDRMSDSLSSQEVRRLYRAMVETLQDAVKYRGSTLDDEQYVDLFGKPGDYQLHHAVYARDGEYCRRCRHVIQRERYGGRSTFYCEACQV